MPEEKKDNFINVSRIYFIPNTPCPFMELEDGSIKKPYFKHTPNGTQLVWYTEEEVVLQKIKQPKKESPILKIN